MVSLYAQCERIYSSGKNGQSSVFDFILKDYPENRWGSCSLCESESPIDPQEPTCLVCGSGISDDY